MPRPEVIARRNLNGSMTEVLSTHAEAEANGWEITRVLRPAAEKPGPKPYHKKVEKPASPQPASPEPASPDTEEEPEQSYDDLYEQAQDLEIRGRSKMDKDQLAAAIAEATEEE